MNNKVFIDVGTNLMQGYNEFKNILNITSDWSIALIEPNPECHENILNNIKTEKNIKLYPVAIDSKIKTTKFITREDDKCNTAGTIQNQEWLVNSLKKWDIECSKFVEYSVETKRLRDILNEYPNFEFYIKMDCEGKEFDILENFDPSDYNIKIIFIEFHPQSDFDVLRANVIVNKLQNAGIQVALWK
jgi:FkbM family methyltransferase